jgi:hypothetical protein
MSFKTAPRGGPVTELDTVTLDLVAGKITVNGLGGKPAHPAHPGHPAHPPKPPKHHKAKAAKAR